MATLPIERYLPQKHPFIMVDEICEADEKRCDTTTLIREKNILVKNHHFIEAGIIENIAQSCASHIGYVEIHIKKCPAIRVGMVALVKNLEITRLPSVGERINTNIMRTEDFGDVSVYSAKISSANEVICSGEFSVVLTDIISKS